MDHYESDLGTAFLSRRTSMATSRTRRLRYPRYRVSMQYVEGSMGVLHPDSIHFAQVTMRSGPGSRPYCGGCVTASDEEIYAQLELILTSAQFLYLKLRLREELALRRLYKSRILPNGTMTSRTGIISLGRFLEFHSCGKRK